MNNSQKQDSKSKINIVFNVVNPQKYINLVCNYGNRKKDVLERFLIKIGKPKEMYYFICNGETSDYNDKRKIESVSSFIYSY